jgi:peptide deformylase
MATLEILTAPHPVLAKKAREVTDDEFTPALRQLLSDMAETMYAAPGVGLAAPQVGDARRIIVFDSDDREHRGRRLKRMVNPTVVERSQETIFWNETCLSVPDFELEVERSKRIRVAWRDETGAQQEDWFEEYEAVIVQHELDHLLGTVLLDRVSAFRRNRYIDRKKKMVKLAKEQLVAR